MYRFTRRPIQSVASEREDGDRPVEERERRDDGGRAHRRSSTRGFSTAVTPSRIGRALRGPGRSHEGDGRDRDVGARVRPLARPDDRGAAVGQRPGHERAREVEGQREAGVPAAHRLVVADLVGRDQVVLVADLVEAEELRGLAREVGLVAGVDRRPALAARGLDEDERGPAAPDRERRAGGRRRPGDARPSPPRGRPSARGRRSRRAAPRRSAGPGAGRRGPSRRPGAGG